ncbi:MAG TPA: hypothetical protein VI937_01945, partial [Negativicutes bacterium]|nr:hypothetical protein [Negativicutes bacterium]
ISASTRCLKSRVQFASANCHSLLGEKFLRRRAIRQSRPGSRLAAKNHAFSPPQCLFKQHVLAAIFYIKRGEFFDFAPAPARFDYSAQRWGGT